MTRHINFVQAIQDPSSVFKTPHEVVVTKEFTREQKLKILRQWEYEEREIEVAEEENMQGPAKQIILDLVLNALNELGAKSCREHSAPNKHAADCEEEKES